MATHELTTNAADRAAAEREARVLEILADGVLWVLPENEDRASRVLDRVREKFNQRRIWPPQSGTSAARV